MKLNAFKGTILAKRLAIIVAMTIAGTMLSPILVKLQGAHLAAVVISAFATIKMAGGLIQPLLLRVNLYTVFWALFVVTIATIVVIFVFVIGFIPEQIFILTMMSFSILEGLFGWAYLRVIKSGIAAMYIEVYDEFQTTAMFLESLASVLTGIILTTLLALFDVRVGLTLGACFLFVAIVIDCLTVKNVWWLDKRKQIIIRRKRK